MNMTNETIKKTKSQKFFFGQNNFDDPEEEIEEAVEEPEAPSFSEEQLESARNKGVEEGYARGKQDGLKEANETTEADLAKALRQISRKIKPLMEQERARASIYEEESVRLTLAIFKKLFPGFQKQYGFLELKTSIETILESQRNHNHIVIQVSRDLAQTIEERLEKISPFKHNRSLWRVDGVEELTHGAFNLSWNDGGAIRDTDAMATEIVRLMEQALAERSTNSHDVSSEPPLEDQHVGSDTRTGDANQIDNSSEEIEIEKEETDDER